MPLNLSNRDQLLAWVARKVGDIAVACAQQPAAVAKRVVSGAMKHRNVGRLTAMKNHAFQGICEASGAALEKMHAVLDELEPEKGYKGPVRWVCAKANGSGKHSCGSC